MADRGIDTDETTAEYLERKRAEIDLVRSYLGEPTGAGCITVAALVEEKRRLRGRLWARAIEGAAGESSLGVAGPSVGGLRLDWKYRRYDLRARARRFLEWVHPRPLPPHLAVGVLAGSGMSAVAAALFALDRQLTGERRLAAAIDTYFETAQLARVWLGRLALTEGLGNARPGDVLLLDSIARREPFAALSDRALDGLAAVVCDTTCWDARGDEVAFAIERCVSAGVPLLLVRSHLKLDCLGLEHGRLGSAVVVLPRPATRAQIAFSRALRLRMLDFLAKSGATVGPEGLFPLAHDPDFLRLNARRNALLRRNNQRAAEALAGRLSERATTQVAGYHHGCFLLLRPLVATEGACFTAADSICRTLGAAGIEARRAPSFAYDHVAITIVAGAQYQSAASLRISLPDLPATEIERAVEVIAEQAAALDPA